MNTFEIDAFAELNREAALVEKQNADYDVAGKNNPRFAHKPKNEIASAQHEHLAFLEAMTDELPYDQLLSEHERLERELEDCRARLEDIDGNLSFEKIAVLAMANKLAAEAFPASRSMQEAIAANIPGAMEKKKKEKIEALEARIIELGNAICELADIIEVAGSQWPIPRAFFIEEPAHIQRVFPPQKGNGDLAKTNGHVPIDDATIVHVDVHDDNPDGNSTNGERTSERRELHIYQPHASVLIAEALLSRATEWLQVSDIAPHVYGPDADESYLSGERRVQIILGPSQGKVPHRLLEEQGHQLEYGWRRDAIRQEDGSIMETKKKRRIYGAFPVTNIGSTDLPETPEYEETRIVDA
jgi:hypothetical protein